MADPVPPHEFILDEMCERGRGDTALAHASGLGITNIAPLIAGKRRITRLVAHGLADAFGTSPDLWLNLQSQWDASQESDNGEA